MEPVLFFITDLFKQVNVIKTCRHSKVSLSSLYVCIFQKAIIYNSYTLIMTIFVCIIEDVPLEESIEETVPYDPFEG